LGVRGWEIWGVVHFLGKIEAKNTCAGILHFFFFRDAWMLFGVRDGSLYGKNIRQVCLA